MLSRSLNLLLVLHQMMLQHSALSLEEFKQLLKELEEECILILVILMDCILMVILMAILVILPLRLEVRMLLGSILDILRWARMAHMDLKAPLPKEVRILASSFCY